MPACNTEIEMTPPLPKNPELEKALGCSVVHYKDAVEYGKACREQALEEAASICDGEKWFTTEKLPVSYVKGFNEGCEECQLAIRRLK